VFRVVVKLARAGAAGAHAKGCALLARVGKQWLAVVVANELRRGEGGGCRSRSRTLGWLGRRTTVPVDSAERVESLLRRMPEGSAMGAGARAPVGLVQRVVQWPLRAGERKSRVGEMKRLPMG